MEKMKMGEYFTANSFVGMSSIAMIITGIITFVACMVINAPYGRYTTGGHWGNLISAKLCWFLMESPNLWTTAIVLITQKGGFVALSKSNFALLCLFLIHYINRSLIFPLRLNKKSNPMPISVASLAFTYCTWNGFTQSIGLVACHRYDDAWLTDPRFIIGSIIFAFGLSVNIYSDSVLMSLKTESNNAYKIPRGGFFEYVSCANYFGEIVEWAGFAIACWSLPSLAFAIFTFCNIGPRAYQHHQWYLGKFEDYPKSRKAVIPFIW